MFYTTSEEIGRQRRHHHQRYQERRQHGQHNRDSHGLKQLAFHAFQTKQRRKHDDNNQHCKKYRSANLPR